MEDLPILTIKSFRGGVSPDKNKGPKGSFKFGQGIDIHGEGDTLKCNQALKKDSGSVVTDLPLVIISASDGNKYAFGDTGKIYRKKSGAWTLVYTDAGGKITGATEFTTTTGKFILYATATKLRKISLTNAGGTWTGNVSDAGTFLGGSSSYYHTMRAACGLLMIADGPYLALYDYDDAFNNQGLTLAPGLLAKAMLDRSTETSDRVIIGTDGDNISGGGWFTTWDGLEDTWLTKKPAQGSVVNGMGFLEGGVVAQVGLDGTLKYWNFGNTTPLRRIPGVQTCYPGGVTEYRTLTHFGMNGGDKNGVYSVGRTDKNDPIAINLEYVPSHGKLTGTEIGGICGDGADLYVGWKDGTTYGIDITDSANKAKAIYESLEMDMGKPQAEKFVHHIKITSAPLPEDSEIRVKYRTTRTIQETAADSEDTTEGWRIAYLESEDGEGEENMTEGMVKGVFTIEGQGEMYEVHVEADPKTNDGNEAPEIYSINNFFDFDNVE